jgi:hyperosmotically inducible periplasmic protein
MTLPTNRHLAGALIAGLLLLTVACGKKPDPIVPAPQTSQPPMSSASSPASATPMSPTSGTASSDEKVSADVKSGLQLNDTVKALDIQVVTLQGDVRLVGTVDNQAQADEAVKVARATSGARTVQDELEIRK